MKEGPVSYVPGGDTAISRELFMNLGGFDETIVTSEDTEFCDRAALSGVPILAIPSLSAVHLGTPQTLSGFYRKQSWHGVNVHRVFLRDVLHSKSRKAMFFAVYMLLAVTMAVFGVCAGAISGSAPNALGGSAALLIGPLALALLACAERKRWNYLLPLTALYAAYGLARAMCLLGIGGARKPRTGSAMAAQTGPATELLS
jgi:cellulose synthase/poly-beta-1,6-N-acetylglucosamine synthase-like glycosyltransferase